MLYKELRFFLLRYTFWATRRTNRKRNTFGLTGFNDLLVEFCGKILYLRMHSFSLFFMTLMKIMDE